MFDAGTQVRIILRQTVIRVVEGGNQPYRETYEVHGTFKLLDQFGVYLGEVDGPGTTFVPHDMVGFIVTA